MELMGDVVFWVRRNSGGGPPATRGVALVVARASPGGMEPRIQCNMYSLSSQMIAPPVVNNGRPVTVARNSRPLTGSYRRAAPKRHRKTSHGFFLPGKATASETGHGLSPGGVKGEETRHCPPQVAKTTARWRWRRWWRSPAQRQNLLRRDEGRKPAHCGREPKNSIDILAWTKRNKPSAKVAQTFCQAHPQAHRSAHHERHQTQNT